MTLADYARAGGWLFHGSQGRHAELEPRQGYDWVSGEPVADGPPAVFATESAAVAIFMAVMAGAVGANGRYGFVRDASIAGGYRFTATSLASAATARGWVHVVPRAPFTERIFDWCTPRAVVPVAAFEVTGADLPPIEIV